MKSAFKFGLVGLMAFVVASLAVATSSGSAQAQFPAESVTKTCVGVTSGGVTAGSTVTCTVRITGAVANPFTIAVTGGATATFDVVRVPAGVGQFENVTRTANAVTVTCFGNRDNFGCDASPERPIVITETITIPAADFTGDVIGQTFNGAALRIANVPDGVLVVSVPTQTFIFCTPTTTTAQVATVTVVNCVVDVDELLPGAAAEFVSSGEVRVSLNVNVPATGNNPLVNATISAGTLPPVGTAGTLLLNCPGPNPGTRVTADEVCDRVAFQINIPANAGAGTITLTALYDPDLDFANGGSSATANVTVVGATAGITGVTKNCTTQPDGVPAFTATQGFVRPGQAVTCVVTVTSATATPILGDAFVASNPNFQFTGGSVSPFNLVTGATVGGFATSTFTETFFPTEAATCQSLTQTVTIAGVPFTVPVRVTSAATTPAGGLVPLLVLPKAGSNQICPGVSGALNFIQPVTMPIFCPDSGFTTFFGEFGLGAVPGEITTQFSDLAGVGVLPRTLVCIADPAGLGGESVLPFVAPGTIEISSVSGVLVDAQGRLTTNLRIPCGMNGPSILTKSLLNVPGIEFVSGSLNTCDGVRFAVAGTGVGFVDIVARYEPAPLPAAAGIDEFESMGEVLFLAPSLPTIALDIRPNASTQNIGVTNQGVVAGTGTAAGTTVLGANVNIGFGSTTRNGVVAPGQLGTITAFLSATGTGNPIACSTPGANGQVFFCVDPTTGLPITQIGLSGLSGEVIIEIADTNVAFFTGATPGSTAGTTGALLSRIAVRCGAAGGGVTQGQTLTNFANFFAGCTSVTAQYQGNQPGTTAVNATFIPDLPGVFGGTAFGLTSRVSTLFGLFPQSRAVSSTAALGTSGSITVTGGAVAGQVTLARGCNNITPTVTETAANFAARVAPAGALVSLFEFQAATGTFLGFSPLAGAPNDLVTVTRLRPIFVCVNAAATLNQPVA